MKYWILVASKDHVMRGVTLGFAQAGHGKRSGLARMHKGDMIVYYSPKAQFEGMKSFMRLPRSGRSLMKRYTW